MRCDAPISVKLDPPKPDGKGGSIYYVPIGCGKCLPCKKNRVNSWSFRLMEELKESISAYFVTLTYDTTTVPITDKGFMTLKKKDFQDFIKRLRENEKSSIKKNVAVLQKVQRPTKIKYYACGEYGEKRKRPHYHAIIFNVTDGKNINKSWTSGTVHIDMVNNNTVDYCLKYIEKDQKANLFAKFDGIKEFSLMSKGIGDAYLRKTGVVSFHKKEDHNYVRMERGYKAPLPKYYRDKILSKEEKTKSMAYIKSEMEAKEIQQRDESLKYGQNYDSNNARSKDSRYYSLKNPLKRRNID